MSDAERVVIITGGSRGIGRAIAFRFAGEKPRLVLLHYDPDDSAAKETLVRLTDQGVHAEAHRIDVSNRGDVDRLFKEVLARFGRVDVLINNAGITKDGLLMRMSEDEWDLVLRVNLKGVFNCSQAVIRSMIKERSGRIVNISSVNGVKGQAGQTNYSAAKAGVIGFTKALAAELANKGVTVNAICPGYVATKMVMAIKPEVLQTIVDSVPMKRLAKPEEIGYACAYLSNELSGFTTGATININGGLYYQ